MERIWVIDSRGTRRFIVESDFDENKMTKIEDESKDHILSRNLLKDILDSGSTPGVVSAIGETRPSTRFNNKLDEGATANLLDAGLEQAKKRVTERKNTYGKAFSGDSYGQRIRKDGNK